MDFTELEKSEVQRNRGFQPTAKAVFFSFSVALFSFPTNMRFLGFFQIDGLYNLTDHLH